MKRPKKCGVRDGRIKEPEYWSWVRMIRRCYEPNYKGYHNYGGRGIKVCIEWRNDYRVFLRDVGPKPSAKHSLDRIDNDKSYYPANVRWVPLSEQPKHRRGVHKITLDGETDTLNGWARRMGISRSTLRKRLKDRLGIIPAFAAH